MLVLTKSYGYRQANGSQNEIFKQYLVEMADHIDPNRDSDMSSKFWIVLLLYPWSPTPCLQGSLLHYQHLFNRPLLKTPQVVQKGGEGEVWSIQFLTRDVWSNPAYLEETDMLKAFQILFDYIQAYPRHAYKYLVRDERGIYISWIY